MTFPINYTPLKNAVLEMVLSGSGTHPYIVPTGSFSAHSWYENRPEELLAHDALTKPIIKVKTTEVRNQNRHFYPYNIRMRDVQVIVEVGYKLDSKVLKDLRYEIETNVVNGASYVERAMSYPGNLITDSLGQPTGLSSGMLQFDRITNIRYNYEQEVAFAQIIFNGVCTLSNSFSGSIYQP